MAGATPRTVRLQDLTVEVSLSGVAQGDLFYRGSSKWNNLAAGTAGNLLATGGSGANPSWASRLTYASSGTLLTVTAGATTDVPFAVNGAASHTGDLQQWKVNGATLAKVRSDGVIGTPNLVAMVGSAPFLTLATTWTFYNPSGIATASFANGWTFSAVSASTTPLTATSAASQSVPVFVVKMGSSPTASLIQLQGQSSTTAGTAQAEIDTSWNVSTHASRSADLILRAYYISTAREGLRIRGGSSDVQLGFYGVTPISRAVLATGAGATADDIITALQNLGLVKQS